MMVVMVVEMMIVQQFAPDGTSLFAAMKTVSDSNAWKTAGMFHLSSGSLTVLCVFSLALHLVSTSLPTVPYLDFYSVFIHVSLSSDSSSVPGFLPS